MKTKKSLQGTPPRSEFSEETFRLLFHHHPAPMWVYDLKTSAFLEVNDTAVASYGYTHDEYLAMTLKDICPPEDVPRLQVNVEKNQSTLQQSGEQRHKLKSGRIIIVEIISHNVEYNGRTAVLVIAIDITERKRLEDAARDSETLLRESQAIAGLGSYVLDISAGIWKSSDVLNRIFGIDHTYVRSVEGWQDIIHPNDRQLMAEYFTNEVLGKRIRFDKEYRIVRKNDNVMRWVHGMGELEVDAQNRLIKMRGTIQDITERKRTEEAIHGSEERFQTIFDESPIGIELYSADGLQVDANRSSLNMFGIRDVSEVLGFNIFDGTSLDDEKKEKLRRGESVIYQSVYDFEKVKKLKQYKTDKIGKAHFDYIITPLLDAVHKTINGYLLQVQDITERKRLELENSVSFEINQGVTTTANLDELLHLIHYSLKKVLFAENCFVALYDPITGLFNFPYFVDQFDTPPPPQSLEKSCTAYVFRTGKPMLITQEDFEQLEKQGKVASVGTPSPEWLGVPLRTPSRTIGVLVLQQYEQKHTYTQRDIEFLTSVGNQIAHAIERKQTEESLLKLSKAISTSGDAIFLTATDGTFIFINPAFTAIYGYTADELVGKVTPRILNSGVLKAGDYKLFWETLTSKREVRMELANRRKDGALVVIETLVNPILDEDENIIGYLAIQRDITERKNAEEKRKSLEAQLQQAQKLESLGTLASGIAHDFNNILSIIIGHASLLERLSADRLAIQKNADAITKAGMRGAALVKQMLTFARKSDVVIESVILNDVVNEVSKLLAETFPKTITITPHLEQRLPSIEADITQIHQVLLNLCVNARDAMPGGGTITITTYRESGEVARAKYPKAVAQNYNVLSVSDSGMGMDEETQRRIFEPFFTTKELGKGTGLGLSLVFGIMESHNGFISVQSELGKGTTFHCYFPAPHKMPEFRQDRLKTVEEIHGSGETILLVEDEEMLRDLVKSFLDSKGFKVLTAEDGEEGIAIFTEHKNEIRLVLSDLGLPKFPGEELFRRLKLLKPDVLFIIASGYVEPGRKAEFFKLGVKKFIDKPYDPEVMIQTIRSVLDN